MPRPAGYSRLQITLHWAIALLIIAQLATSDAIGSAWDAMEDGLVPAFDPVVAMHVFGGLLVLALVIVRIVVRLRRGAPPAPESEPRALKILAHAVHGSLYLLLILLPVSGAAAWFAGAENAADGHEMLKNVLLALIVLHVAGALTQHFVLKSGVLRRMMRAQD